MNNYIIMTALPAFLKSCKILILLIISMTLEFILPIVPALVVMTYLIIMDRIKALQILNEQQEEYSNSLSRRRSLKKFLEYAGLIVLTHYLGTFYFPSLKMLFIDELFRNYPYVLYGLVTLEIISTELESISKHSKTLNQPNSPWVRLHYFIQIPTLFINNIVEKVKNLKEK